MTFAVQGVPNLAASAAEGALRPRVSAVPPEANPAQAAGGIPFSGLLVEAVGWANCRNRPRPQSPD